MKKLTKFALGVLAFGMGQGASAHDLAAPGHGFENWQWFCQADGKRAPDGEVDFAEGGAKAVPFAIEKDGHGVRRWVYTGKHPFDPALVASAKGVIEPRMGGAKPDPEHLKAKDWPRLT